MFHFPNQAFTFELSIKLTCLLRFTTGESQIQKSRTVPHRRERPTLDDLPQGVEALATSEPTTPQHLVNLTRRFQQHSREIGFGYQRATSPLSSPFFGAFDDGLPVRTFLQRTPNWLVGLERVPRHLRDFVRDVLPCAGKYLPHQPIVHTEQAEEQVPCSNGLTLQPLRLSPRPCVRLKTPQKASVCELRGG